MNISLLQKARYEYKPKLPESLAQFKDVIDLNFGEAAEAVSDREELKSIFKLTYGKPIVTFKSGNNINLQKKLKIGVILSGGQAPGGHNVIAGLYDGLKTGNANSTLIGFLGGPGGLIENKTKIITREIIDAYRNTGGFDMIGSGRTKIESPEQFAAALETVKDLNLDAIVIIGGDDSNTNAALLAEYFLHNGSKTQVIGCPKTIDGDLKNEFIETSFGFDTACKVYSELIGNLMRDANSAKKYWHFIKLMGRAASHITLECALQTQPNICLISEEIEKEQYSLDKVVEIICESIIKRAENGENFGVVLIPEGLVEFIPEIKQLINELNETIAQYGEEFLNITSFIDQLHWFLRYLSESSYDVLRSLPPEIAREFLSDRDPHGNVQVSMIQTEKLLMGMTAKKLNEYKERKIYKGKFCPVNHFFGYEGRCAFPSNFDADYCYSLGYTAFALIACGLTGYIANVLNLSAPANEWVAGGIPLTMMMNIERRHGKKQPVIKKALVNLDGMPFKTFRAMRDKLAEKTNYLVPGSIQYFGPSEICDRPSETLLLEKNANFISKLFRN
ncbi:MAG: diphosphate--fructose-6-phosphate 1-phosphotransferase [Treponema sp.]|nr:diphosphate--fructose-6-phosphate 1-phosphotransferase [Treponema sp.]